MTVTTSSGANAPVVAQTAVLGLLSLARHWPTLLAAQRERRWAPLIATGLPRDLQGQTAVLVGWGPVGEIGRLLQARAAGGCRAAQFRELRAWRAERPASAARSAALGRLAGAGLRTHSRHARLIGARELALLPAHCCGQHLARRCRR